MSDSATILIIEDTDGTRDQLVRMVESLGYRTIAAKSGLEGLQHLAQVSLVLLDVVMPSFDGFKIAAMIRAQPRFVPVILLTGLDDLETKRRGQSAGADDFLSKPVEPLELQIRLAAMLRIKSLTDALDAANRRLAELAETDPLTGVVNRRGFDALYAVEYQRAKRYRRPLTVLMVDLDHFKRVNDGHGHAMGDEVLRVVARALDETIRQSDHVARLGGEEFVVVAPEVPGAGAQALAERLRKRIEELQIGPLKVTTSIGCAVWDGQRECGMAALLEQADQALYQAKEQGRNRVVVAPG